MSGLRVVMDTNVLVSGLAFPDSTPGRIMELWGQGSVAVVLSRYILDEMVRVLPHMPRNKRGRDEIRALADSFIRLAEVVEPDDFVEERLRDPADQQILGTLRASNADYLITGDKDLLALADAYPIVTPAAFWQRRG